MNLHAAKTLELKGISAAAGRDLRTGIIPKKRKTKRKIELQKNRNARKS